MLPLKSVLLTKSISFSSQTPVIKVCSKTFWSNDSTNPSNKLVVGGGAHTALAAVTFSATAMTMDCTSSNVFVTTLTGSVTTAPSITNPGNGQTINWFITQDSVGSRTMVWPTSFKWPGGVDGVLSTAPNAEDLLVATYRSATTSWYATLAKDFKA